MWQHGLGRVPPTHPSMLQAGGRADPVVIRIRELSLTTHQLQPLWREQDLYRAWTRANFVGEGVGERALKL